MPLKHLFVAMLTNILYRTYRTVWVLERLPQDSNRDKLQSQSWLKYTSEPEMESLSSIQRTPSNHAYSRPLTGACHLEILTCGQEIVVTWSYESAASSKQAGVQFHSQFVHPHVHQATVACLFQPFSLSSFWVAVGFLRRLASIYLDGEYSKNTSLWKNHVESTRKGYLRIHFPFSTSRISSFTDQNKRDRVTQSESKFERVGWGVGLWRDAQSGFQVYYCCIWQVVLVFTIKYGQVSRFLSVCLIVQSLSTTSNTAQHASIVLRKL